MMFRLPCACAAIALALPLAAEEVATQAAPSPGQIVDAAAANDWVSIEAEDLLVMTLAPDRDGNPREVVIQLMPAPFSQGWVANIRTLARAKWYDGTSVNRVQDNYVVQWGDANYDNPEAEGEAKPLPEGLRVMDESDYSVAVTDALRTEMLTPLINRIKKDGTSGWTVYAPVSEQTTGLINKFLQSDPYAFANIHYLGWPVSSDSDFANAAPVHCYGMVGVGRGMAPDAGSGAELYTVIGHAPRHLDRNIALVGRIVSGMEHLSSLPRGSGALGFYTAEEAEKRTPILSIRVASDLPESEQPQFEYLDTGSETFARYVEARANRRDPFFIQPAGGVDICNVPVPIREAKVGE